MEQVLTWIVTGIVVGLAGRVAVRGSGHGPAGDVTAGCLGAVFGGWLTQRLGVPVGGVAAQVPFVFVGAITLFALLRVARRLTLGGDAHSAANHPPLVAELEAQLHRAGDLERQVLATVLRKRSVLRNPNQAFDAQLTFGGRVADHVATFGGSWTFIGWFLTLMLIWMAVNEEITAPFDPYPFILLNLILSCLAALQAPVIMMSQNRQSAKDRLDAHHDYEVNVRAELQILALHEKLDLARIQDWDRIARLLQEQGERLDAIERRLTQWNAGESGR